MNTRFGAEEERFRAEVRELLVDHRDLDGYFRQGERWPRVKALFQRGFRFSAKALGPSTKSGCAQCSRSSPQADSRASR